MSARDASSRPTAFAFMTATIVVGFFVLTRLGPGAGPGGTPLSAVFKPGANAERGYERELEELRARREKGYQMLGAVEPDPYGGESRTLASHPGQALPRRDFNAPAPSATDMRPLPLYEAQPYDDGPAQTWNAGPMVSRQNDPNAAPLSQSRALRTGERRYVVRENDSIVSIAEREMGSKLMAPRLIQANPILRGNPRPEAGMELVIPATDRG